MSIIFKLLILILLIILTIIWYFYVFFYASQLLSSIITTIIFYMKFIINSDFFNLWYSKILWVNLCFKILQTCNLALITYCPIKADILLINVLYYNFWFKIFDLFLYFLILIICNIANCYFWIIRNIYYYIYMTKWLVFQVKFSSIVFYLEFFSKSYFLSFNNLQLCNSIFILYLLLYILKFMKFFTRLQVIT